MTDSPPARRPNVVIVLFDDLGFADLGCFGSEIATPNIDRLARRGLRFDNFMVTPICSASRAALLTGRNHHAVGVATCTNAAALEEPGYTNRIPPSAATLARVLRDSGYRTYAFGKWHLTPPEETDHAGPFDLWPSGLGFDHFYGFLGGMTNQYAPDLVEDTALLPAPEGSGEGYHLTEDLADRMIAAIGGRSDATRDAPFFAYFAPGAVHGWHQVPATWSDAYRGRYDRGWDVIRQERYERQLAEGIIPPGTLLAALPPALASWEDLSDLEQRVFARQMEVYAGFVTHTDAQVGRVIDHLEELGELDDTVFLVLSDNGAAAEGGPTGMFGSGADLEEAADHLDEFGGPRTGTLYSWGWAAAGTTPFPLWKLYTWRGGVSSPLVLHWPAGTSPGDAGAVRRQFSHVTDLLPTVLDAAGVAMPAEVDGVAQQPLHGASLLPVVTDVDAASPHPTQYFEMLGSRSIVHDGWKATTDHVRLSESHRIPGSTEYATDRWALADLERDYSESTDVALDHPERLADLVALWHAEAERYGALPLADPEIPGATAAPYPRTRVFADPPVGGPVRVRSPWRDGLSLVADIDAEEPDGVLASLHNAAYGWTFLGGVAVRIAERRVVVEAGRAARTSVFAGSPDIGPGRHRISVEIGPAGPVWRVTASVDGALALTGELTRGEPSDSEMAILWIGTEDGVGVGDYERLPPPFGGRITFLRLGIPGEDEDVASPDHDLDFPA